MDRARLRTYVRLTIAFVIVSVALDNCLSFNEILAHARAAREAHPDVDTIFEIGGQDAKFVSLLKGIPVDYAMNDGCSAGTGSFLEEAAASDMRYGAEEIGPLALQAEAPLAFGERCAMNSPIQGTAADIIKLAMIAVDEALRQEGFDAKLILQIHDELIVEAPEAEAERVRELLRRCMEGVVKLSVPLKTDISIGGDWRACK